MSKHSVRAGDIAGLLKRFAQLKEKARARTGRDFPIITLQEAGLDGFWIHRVLQSEGIESHVVDPASIATSRRRRRAKTDKIDGETLVRTLLAYKRGEPRVCAMVKVPIPEEEEEEEEEEDSRRLCRESKVLTAERDLHVNRIKGLLFCQGICRYEPLRRDRCERLEELQTRRPSLASAPQSASQPRARSARTAAQADQSRGGRAGRAAGRRAYPRRGAGVDVAEYSRHWTRVRRRTLVRRALPTLRQPTLIRSPLMRAWRRHPGRAEWSIGNRGCPKPEIPDCEQR
jgi:transposase